jgi:ribosomal protein S18 acetylase RimI-like enzyme
MQTKVEILPMTRDHLFEVARVHTASFKGFFLTLLGEPFLRVYYSSVLQYHKSIALVAVDENLQVVGLAAGFKDPSEFYRHFRLYWVRMLPAVVMGLLRRPWLMLIIFLNVIRVSKVSRTGTGCVVELASICTIVGNQRIGSTLLTSFMLRAQEMGACEVALTTDELDNSAVRVFYERHGFVEQGRQQRGRRVLVAYSIVIDQSILR